MRPPTSQTLDPSSRIECSTSLPAHRHAVADRGERSDVGVLDDGAAADDGGAPHRALRDAGAGLHDHLAQDLALLDLSLRAWRQRVEDDAVGLQHVLEPARVLPPSLDHVRPHEVAMVDQPLDGVRDLELAARRRHDGLHRLEDRRVEHVHADQRQVRGRRLRLLDEPHDIAVAQLGHAELARVGHRARAGSGYWASPRGIARPAGPASRG